MVQSSATIFPRGAGRLEALNALERALVGDTVATLSAMVGSGWSVEDALDSYRDWLHRLIDAGVDEGVCLWIAEQVAA